MNKQRGEGMAEMKPPSDDQQLPEDVKLMIEAEEISQSNRERFQQLFSDFQKNSSGQESRG